MPEKQTNRLVVQEFSVISDIGSLFCSYSTDVVENSDVVKKLACGENAPINKVYKPEFVTLAPPLLNCEDEV